MTKNAKRTRPVAAKRSASAPPRAAERGTTPSRASGATANLVPLVDGTRAAAEQLARLAARGQGPAGVEAVVRRILDAVRKEGDAAVARFTKEFDGVSLAPRDFEVPAKEIAAARKRVPKKLLAALEAAYARIRAFHERERERSFEKKEPGIRTGMRLAPLARAGVYVPGGKAAYPSSVLMNIAPARVAGVGEITVVTPPSKDGIQDAVLAAASIAGATRVLRIGGAQAVGALAYGTKTIARVDKIVGPGNIYVATAKRLVFGEVDIDMVAGPSEVLIIADQSANPEWVAADMLAQAEHDELAASICITTSIEHARAVAVEVARQCAELSRATIAARSLERFGTILVASSLERACELADEIAPEHLEVFTKSPRKLLPRLHNAGAIFLGALTTESIGDYAAGPNHVLPTGGAARFSSPLGVYDFVKRTSIIEVDRSGFDRLAPIVTELATAEGLEAHGLAVVRRMKKNR
jgi:histidinol dehydrogenase